MNPTQAQKRITSIDLLRGAVMIIMALDHVRDYFHSAAFMYNPLDLEKTSVVLFFTRWITHFCAPVFVFLAGSSAFISGQKKTKRELSIFLLKRGLWLILLEFTVVLFAWDFDISFGNKYFVVIWILGVCMIFLAALIHLPMKILLLIGILLVAGHNLLDNIHVEGNTLPGFGWALLHDQRFFSWQGRNFLVGYPLIPWVGLMGLGYCMGRLFTPNYNAQQRKKWLLILGSSATGLFILLRLLNIYGDPVPWSHQPLSTFSFLSFLNTNKYPPSLLYTLMTIGPSLIFLAFTENIKNRLTDFISVYGRVPMFYYILHIYLIHLAAMFAAEFFTTYDWKIWILKEPIWFATSLRGYGFGLGVVYLVWIGVVLSLYPFCRWYDRYKAAHREKWWLSYL